MTKGKKWMIGCAMAFFVLWLIGQTPAVQNVQNGDLALIHTEAAIKERMALPASSQFAPKSDARILKLDSGDWAVFTYVQTPTGRTLFKCVLKPGQNVLLNDKYGWQVVSLETL